MKDVFEREKDGRLLIPILPALPLEELKHFLPNILLLSANVLEAAVEILLTKTQLTPIELIVQVHRIQAKENMKQCMQFLELTLKREAIFTEKTMAVIFQQLIELDPIPSLFMWTVIRLPLSFSFSSFLIFVNCK